MPLIYKNGSHTINFIEKQDDLADCLPIITDAKSIAIDLEFDHNLFRYGFQLCLIQIATENVCFVRLDIIESSSRLRPSVAHTSEKSGAFMRNGGLASR